MKRVLMLCGVLGVAAAQPALGQDWTAPDSLLESGLPAKAWTRRDGWFTGVLARLFPPGTTACLGVQSDTVGGFVGIARIDSLFLDTSAVNLAHVLQRSAPDPQLVRWRKAAVAPLRARETGCDWR